MPFNVTKTYGPTEGFSCCFRQWRATHSHCSLLHGYALGFRFTFACDELNYCHWVVDFGGLFKLKQALKNNFDHRLILAKDDPHIDKFVELDRAGVAKLLVLESVGTESFAKYAHSLAAEVLLEIDCAHRVWVAATECFEHESNGAVYIP
jgi:6-pyruvoyltetrahydropterin/6-carboxytetrahydropterin synthase